MEVGLLIQSGLPLLAFSDRNVEGNIPPSPTYPTCLPNGRLLHPLRHRPVMHLGALDGWLQSANSLPFSPPPPSIGCASHLSTTCAMEQKRSNRSNRKREINSQASKGRSMHHREGYTLRAPSSVTTAITLPHADMSTTVFGGAANCSAIFGKFFLLSVRQQFMFSKPPFFIAATYSQTMWTVYNRK